MKNIIQYLYFVLLVVYSTSCSLRHQHEGEEEAEEVSADAIEITAEQMKAVDIRLGAVEMKNLSSVVRAKGQLVLLPQSTADVNSLTSGIIREIAVSEGAVVRKGQPVAMLENLDVVKLQESYLTLKHSLAYSEQEYERQQSLSAQNAGTGKLLQQAQASYEADKARLQGLETQLQMLNINVKSLSDGHFVRQIPILAPIGGVVAKVYVRTGSYADMQTTLMQINDNSQVQCELQIFAKDLAKVQTGQTVEMELTNVVGASRTRPVTGTIYRINSSFEDDSKSIGVHVKVDWAANSELTIPGMFVSALIHVGSHAVRAVPAGAIAEAEGKQYIFMQVEADGDGDAFVFKEIEVVTGIRELGYVEIAPTEALPDEARIITKGAFYVMSKVNGGEEE